LRQAALEGNPEMRQRLVALAKHAQGQVKLHKMDEARRIRRAAQSFRSASAQTEET